MRYGLFAAALQSLPICVAAIDWMEPHRVVVKVAVRAVVKRVLRAKGIQPSDFVQFILYFMSQAEALFSDLLNAIAA